jgi:hypothetical protein
MAPPSDQDDLAIAWRALGATEPRQGWRTIALAPGLPVRVLAARSFPGNEEAIVVGFRNVRVPPAQQLPQGRGFAVERVDPGLGGVWIALSRQGTASLTLFSLMAQDVIGTLAGAAPGQEEAVLHAFLARIRAWQEFMLKGSDGMLGPDAEVGLLGELLFLGDLLRLPMEPSPVIEAWQGPLDGLQDFVLGTGAVEVKTTLVMGAFPAVIASLEQLDDSLRRPLYVAAVRLSLAAVGETLAERVAEIRQLLSISPGALSAFNTRLLRVGYLDAMSARYQRRFSPGGSRLLLVALGFPRLTRADVAAPIRKATYEIDLDLVRQDSVPLRQALQHLGIG